MTNPAPTLTGLAPVSGAVGGPTFILTANGSGFVPASVVKFGSMSLVTSYVSATQLTALVPAGQIAALGNVAVTVVNSAPGGTSGPQQFAIIPGTATTLAVSGYPASTIPPSRCTTSQ